MGFLTPKTKSYYYSGTRTGVTRPVASKANAESDAEDAAADDNNDEKKVYDKEKAVLSNAQAPEEETETDINTKLNALLYHFSDDSIDRYRLENNSLDLLGRLYYDDFDPRNQVLNSVVSPTSLSPSILRTASPQPGLNFERPLFLRQVSFDTLSDAHHLAITLKVKHPQFRFRRNNKTYLIGFSNDAESLRAVEWAFQQFVNHGDTIVVFQVLDEKNYRRVDPQLAETVLVKLQKLNTHARRISLVYEVVIGRPQKLLRAAIAEYSPNMMIVGSHQYGQAALPTLSSLAHIVNSTHHLHLPLSLFSKTSISQYFLQFALVPVVLVKPFYTFSEKLDAPIDSPDYFHRWLANIDVTHTREKKKKHVFGRRSKNSSSTALSDLAPAESRGRSTQSGFTIGSRDSSSLRSPSRSKSRSEHTETPEDSRSQSKTRSRLGKFFSS